MRCYDGCPDSQLQAIIDERFYYRKKLKQIIPEACCTYHHPGPDKGGWQVHEWGKPLSSFHNTEIGAIKEAIQLKEKR